MAAVMNTVRSTKYIDGLVATWFVAAVNTVRPTKYIDGLVTVDGSVSHVDDIR